MSSIATQGIEPSIVDLSDQQFYSLVEALNRNMYRIVGLDSSHTNGPEGIKRCYKTVETYQFIFDDPLAFYRIFAIVFDCADEQSVLPLGVFGVSPINRMLYPLQLNHLGRSFISIGKDDFYKTVDAGELAEFDRLCAVRETFMSRIFTFYRNVSSGYTAVMAWPMKKKQSATRDIAMANGYQNLQFEDRQVEIFTDQTIRPTKLQFIHECGQRWQIADKACAANEDASAIRQLSAERYAEFYRRVSLL
jgi:hypothetical protein